MLGLKHITVKLVPHCYKWRYLFQEEVLNIRKALNNRDLKIEHVGSTALNDIAAKPILDIFIPCEDLNTVADYVQPLAKLGYELITDVSNYKLFIKGSEEARTHHLTFTSPEGKYWQETIQFRDYLLAHPETAKAYEAEKIQLAEQYADSRRNYSLNKARFIQTILREINKNVRTATTVPTTQTIQTSLPLPLLSTHINPINPVNPRALVLPLTQADIDNFVDAKRSEKSNNNTNLKLKFQEQSTKRI